MCCMCQIYSMCLCGKKSSIFAALTTHSNPSPMLRFLRFTLLLIFFGAAFPAESQVDTSPAERTTVSWSRDTLDFGVMEEGAILLDSFTVTNTGAVPYQIRSVRTSCDCTVLRYPKSPVQPGKTATIRVEFDSRGKSGLAQPGIILYDNSMPNLRSILYFNGRIVPRKKPKNAMGN